MTQWRKAHIEPSETQRVLKQHGSRKRRGKAKRKSPAGAKASRSAKDTTTPQMELF